MSTRTPAAGERGSRAALAVLVALVVVSPWPFGSVHLRTTQAIALVSLVTALAAFLYDGWRGELARRGAGPARLLPWLLLGLWALAILQVIPLPEGLHRLLAPGTAAVWHPAAPAAAAVLGSGSHPVSLDPEATRRWLALATGLGALVLAAAPAFRERRSQLRTAITIVAGAVFLSVYGLVARLVFGDKLFGVWTVPTVAPFGPFVSKNHFAGYVEMAALLAVGLATGLADEARHGRGGLGWIESRRAKWVVLAWGAALVLILAVPVSLSRGGTVSLVAGLLGYAGLRLLAGGRSPLSPRAVAVAFVGVLIAAASLMAVLPVEARDRLLSLAGVTSEQSGSYRLGVWRDTLRLVGSSPLVGSGFGAYEDALPRFKTSAGHLGVEHAENDYLEVAAEGGVSGALLVGASIVLLLLVAAAGVGSEEHRLARALRGAAVAAVLALLVHSAFDFNLRIPSNAAMAALLAALALGPGDPASPSAEASRSRRRLGVVAAVLAVSLALALLTPWHAPRVRSSSLARADRRAAVDLRRLALESDLASLLRRRPAQAAAWVQLGWLRLPTSRPDGVALARWGASLDPAHEELAQAARVVEAGGR